MITMQSSDVQYKKTSGNQGICNVLENVRPKPKSGNLHMYPRHVNGLEVSWRFLRAKRRYV